MSTDYRALCVELMEALENAIRVIHHEDGTRHISTADAVIAKADAALAQPEPEGPTDEELEEAPFLYAPEWYNNEMAAAWEAGRNSGWRDALARWGRPTITPIPVSEGLPEPVGPTDEELDSVFHEHCWTGDDLMDHDDFVKAARAVLARWVRPAITPIPVSERLPGPEDCDAEGRCWFGMWGEIDGEMIPDWELTRLEDYTNEGRLRLAGWLPAHALPLPATPENADG